MDVVYDDRTVESVEKIKDIQNPQRVILLEFHNATLTPNNLDPFRGGCLKYILGNISIGGISAKGMFSELRCLEYVPSLDTSRIIDMSNMFSGCISFNHPLEFDTVNVTNMREMFMGCTAFNQQLLFDVCNVIDTTRMVYGCAIIEHLRSEAL